MPGRKRRQKYSVGVDVGGTKIAVGVVDAKGRLTAPHREPTEVAAGAEHILDQITRSVKRCLGATERSAMSVGIGLAGQIDRSGVVRTSPNLHWRNVRARQDLERRLKLPVRILNDVRAATLAEWKFGAGKGEDDIVCLYIGTGIGGGVVSGGQLLEGASNIAGELGHTTLVAGGRKCTCRNFGCFEAYLGGWAIAERAQEAARTHRSEAREVIDDAGSIEQIDGAIITRAAKAGDRFARDFLEETADYLGAGLVSIANAYNPAVLILGGGVIDATPSLISSAETRVKARAFPSATEVLRVVPAMLGGDAIIVGAATWSLKGLE